MAIIRAKSGNGSNLGGLSDGRFRVPDPIIPNADFSGMPSPGSMNALANDPSRNQLLVASRDACIPILYGGPEKLAGKLYIAKIYGSTLYLAQIFCEGQVERIGTTGGETSDRLGIYVNDVDASTYTGIAIHKHLGSASPTADSWLTTVLASESYAETLANTAYLVAEIQAGAFTGVPRITAEVMGRKVYDPRQNLFAGSNDVGNVTYWTVGGSITASKTVAGPYGATNYATSLNDTSNSVASYMTQAVTVANDSATYYVHLKIEKGSRPTVGINVNLAGGTGVAQTFRFNPSSGAYSGGSNVTVTAITSSWWEVSFSITNNTTGNTSLGVAIYPAIAAAGVLSPDDATATGSNVFCEFQVRKSTVSAGYVETTTTAVNQPTQWSDNPALCLGDFLASSTYGEGRTVDQASLALAAEYCDQMVGATSLANEKRSRMTLLLDSRQPTRSWRDILRAYVPCWVIIDGDTAYLKVDRAGSSDHTFTASSIDSAELPVLRRSGVQDVPTAVVIRWTDTSVLPWKTVTAEQDTGASPRRVTRIDMPGIRSYSQARRFAIERLNHYSLEDLTGEISVFEDGLKVYPGDIATITDAVGLSSKLVRILGAQDKGHGRWRLRWREYDPAAYSNVVETTPTYPDMVPMSPNDVPQVTGVTLTEERIQESGVWATRLVVTWNEITTWPYVDHYEVDVFDNRNSSIFTGTYTWSGGYINLTSYPGGPWGTETVNPAYLDFTSGDAPDGRYMVFQQGVTILRADLPGSGTGGNVTVSMLQGTETSSTTSWRSQPIKIGTKYTVLVRAVSSSGAVGADSTAATITPAASASYGGTTQAPAYVASSAPSVPVAGTVWADSSGTGYAVKVYNGSSWETVGGNGGQPTYSWGTANGVVYINASKVLTSGSALVFDGTNLGIGVLSPSYALDVQANAVRVAGSGTGTGYVQLGKSATDTNNWHMGSQGDGYFYLWNGTYGAGLERFRMAPSGEIRVGFSNGNDTFIRSGDILIRSNTDYQPQVNLRAYQTSSAGTYFIATKSRGTISSPTAAVNGDGIMNILSQARNAAGTDKNLANISTGVSEAESGNEFGSTMVFSTSKAGVGMTDRMWINHSGNVGIGTSPAVGPLHLYASGNAAYYNRLENATDSTASGATHELKIGTKVAQFYMRGASHSNPEWGLYTDLASSPFKLWNNGAVRLVVEADGRLYGTALHNNAGAVTGTTNQYIASGTYTPTLTGVTNVDATTAYTCQWMRVGNVVTVSGLLAVDPTFATTFTRVGISLPIASNFTSAENLGGTAGSYNGTANDSAYIAADAGNDRADFCCFPGWNGSVSWSFHFQYLVA